MNNNLLIVKGKPSALLMQIMSIVTSQEKDWGLQDIHEYAQQNFIRPAGLERWQVIPNPDYEAKKEELLPLFKKLGFIGEVWPQKTVYDHITVNGGSVFDMPARILWLDKCWQKGVRASTISILEGQRLLDSAEENILKTHLLPHMYNKSSLTEADATRLLWENLVQEPDLKQKEIAFFSLPVRADLKTPKMYRPTTKDTYVALLEKFPASSSILSISNNPYIYYQHQVFLKVLEEQNKKNFEIETVGPANPSREEDTITNYLDTLARCIYVGVVGA
jgi:hypothetical protein